MKQIILDRASSSKLQGIQDEVELCDESGNLLGSFSTQEGGSRRDSFERIVLDSVSAAKLLPLKRRVQLCDESGTVLGFFSPQEHRSLYDGAQIPFTEDGLREAEQDSVCYTPAVILAYLKSLDRP